MGDVAKTIVLPFSQQYSCPECSFTRTPVMQPKRRWCPGVSRESNPAMRQATDDACRFGETAHLHIDCTECGFTFGMETANGEPALTASEVGQLRELLAELTKRP